VPDAATSELVRHAADLERQDQVVAAQLDTLAALGERAASVRDRAAEVRAALERVPAELEDVARRIDEADVLVAQLREELRLAEERRDALESARRQRAEEILRAQREATTARELVADAEAQVRRLHARAGRLHADAGALRAEAGELAAAAAAVATDLRAVPGVPDGAGGQPGETFAELEQWGLLVRSALLVARGTLETQRERIVAEANALGSSALGEHLGASSVALVRRRLEAELL